MPNIINVPLSALRPNPYQPPGRLAMPEEQARKGGESILRSGLIQIPVARGKDGVYEIGDGWQRKCWYEWLVKNGHPEFDSLPVDLRELIDEQMADLIEETDENKQNMTVFDRAWLWKKRLADFPKITQKDFAARRGISQGELSNTIRLLDLPEKVQAMIISGEISESHGRALLALKEPSLIFGFATQIEPTKMSVTKLEDEIKEYLNRQKPKLKETPPEEDIAEGDTEENIETAAEAVEEELTQLEREEQTIVSEKPDNISEEAQTVTEKAGELAVEIVQNTFGKKPAAQKTPPKPPAAAPLPPAPLAKPNWSRKIIIEEKQDYCIASCMKAGGVPVAKKMDGDFHHAVAAALQWVEELEEQWNKEGK